MVVDEKLSPCLPFFMRISVLSEGYPAILSVVKNLIFRWLRKTVAVARLVSVTSSVKRLLVRSRKTIDETSSVTDRRYTQPSLNSSS